MRYILCSMFCFEVCSLNWTETDYVLNGKMFKSIDTSLISTASINLTPWGTVLIEKLITTRLVKKIHLSRKPKVHNRVENSPSLIHMTPVHAFLLHFKSILPSKQSLPFGSSNQISARNFISPTRELSYSATFKTLVNLHLYQHTGLY
jgi:hypothetical protein